MYLKYISNHFFYSDLISIYSNFKKNILETVIEIHRFSLPSQNLLLLVSKSLNLNSIKIYFLNFSFWLPSDLFPLESSLRYAEVEILTHCLTADINVSSSLGRLPSIHPSKSHSFKSHSYQPIHRSTPLPLH